VGPKTIEEKKIVGGKKWCTPLGTKEARNPVADREIQGSDKEDRNNRLGVKKRKLRPQLRKVEK